MSSTAREFDLPTSPPGEPRLDLGASGASGDLQDYQAFLAGKRLVDVATGITVSEEELHGKLFPFQRSICRWALKRGRAAVFAATGTGKTFVEAEFGRQVYQRTGRDVLILAPLAVSHQTAREALKIDLNVTVCRRQADVRPGVNVTNYEVLHNFSPEAFGGLVCDECFVRGTLVDTPIGPRPIEQIQVGDEIWNAVGTDRILAVARKELSYAIRIRTEAGSEIVSSGNHPFFTSRGYIRACNIRPGENLMETAQAVRLVRNRIHPQISRIGNTAVLQSILRGEMEDGSTTRESTSSQPRGASENRRRETATLGFWKSKSHSGERAIQSAAHGQWIRSYGTPTTPAGCLGFELEDGTPEFVLQDRLGKPRLETRNRIGRTVSSGSETPSLRCEEGCEIGFARVESVEILQPGHPDLDQYRDASGKLHFYDLEAARHPSFSVNGLLVHNSSILKSYEGAVRKEITEFGARVPFRMAATATPAPNDFIELTNHAEFLGIMQQKEVLALFFTQDEGLSHKWRLKGHARHDFWRWLASWAVACRAPSDLGYEDGDFILPPLNIHQVTVSGDVAPAGRLFAVEAQTLDEVRAAMRASLPARVAACAELANGNDEPWLIWCNLNDESTELKRAIPDAVEVRGSDSTEHKERALLDFIEGKKRVLVSKPSICGWGLNLQHCARIAFVGLSFSWEAYYQAIRRCWRFGQKRSVECYVVTSEMEGAVVRAIERKEKQAGEMMGEIVSHMQGLQLNAQGRDEEEYRVKELMRVPDWMRGVSND